MSTVTLKVFTDYDGRLSTILPGTTCPGCGCEPEVISYFTRDYKQNGETVKVRVGYHCTCSAVVVDGFLEGNDPNLH